MSFLEIEAVSKNYGNLAALKHISLSIEKGELVCLLGPSGCGKTTLLRIIGGLEDSHEGKLFLNGRNITNSSPHERNFGIVFQSYALFPNMTVYKNIAFGVENKKVRRTDIRKRVKEVLELVELQGCDGKYPSELSGGMQQRVALARALAPNPDFLLLDEPLSALDAKVRVKLRNQIRTLQKQLNITTIMVTHDQEEALTMADKIVVMNSGEIMQIGTPQEIYKAPANSFVADFIGSINFIEPMVGKEIYAIRPEDVILKDAGCKNALTGILQDIEYKGSHYLGTVLYKSTNIKVNLPTSLIEKHNAKVGDTIYFNFSYENAVKLNKESCA